MSYQQKSDPLKNTFPLPNEIFLLDLCPGELAVYAFLRHCENRKTHQCWPSYKTIGNAVGMTENTAAKYVNALECKGLIQTESTSVITKDGKKRNGNLLYTIPPFRPILDAHYHQQSDKLALDRSPRPLGSPGTQSQPTHHTGQHGADHRPAR